MGNEIKPNPKQYIVLKPNAYEIDSMIENEEDNSSNMLFPMISNFHVIRIYYFNKSSRVTTLSVLYTQFRSCSKLSLRSFQLNHSAPSVLLNAITRHYFKIPTSERQLTKAIQANYLETSLEITRCIITINGKTDYRMLQQRCNI